MVPPMASRLHHRRRPGGATSDITDTPRQVPKPRSRRRPRWGAGESGTGLAQPRGQSRGQSAVTPPPPLSFQQNPEAAPSAPGTFFGVILVFCRWPRPVLPLSSVFITNFPPGRYVLRLLFLLLHFLPFFPPHFDIFSSFFFFQQTRRGRILPAVPLGLFYFQLKIPQFQKFHHFPPFPEALFQLLIRFFGEKKVIFKP